MKNSIARDIRQYNHVGQKRLNNPPIELVDHETDQDLPDKKYEYDPHIAPSLQWAGKKEHLSFKIPTVSLHVHERIDTKTIIDSLKKSNNSDSNKQLSLFETKEENPPLREAIEFYKHNHNWSNRLIAGDSLSIMNSLVEKEGMAGHVQMIYFDPPYGIKYGSNFQPFVNRKDVKDGKDEDLSQEPETIKAFRDTWELGIHSYLTYLRDRLLLAKDLLSESGSIFMQISDENVHLVRCVMDEVFGRENFVREILFRKKAGLGQRALPHSSDYLIWYSKNALNMKYRQLFLKKSIQNLDHFSCIELPDGTRRNLTPEEKSNTNLIPKNSKLFRIVTLHRPENSIFEFEYCGQIYKQRWTTNINGLNNLAQANRLSSTKDKVLRYVSYYDDLPVQKLKDVWTDTMGEVEKVYAVQTTAKVIQRCILMTTDPGDLVLDPTCGSGTTAYVAEQWGRRWITCDTS